jgi:hypothetical protein
MTIRLGGFVRQAAWFTSGAAAVGAAITFGLLTGSAPQASAQGNAHANAAVPGCVANGDYGTIAGVEDPSDSTSDDIRGTRSDVQTPAGPTSCQRISSVYVQTAAGGGFEFGWVIGYSNCSGSTYAHPHLFYWGQYANGTHTCGMLSPVPSEGTTHSMRVSDTDGNTYWGAYYQGTQLQPNGVNMDFAKGFSIVAMERGGSNDSGAARWNNLEEYHDGNAWTNWDNASNGGDYDPAYHFNRVNAYTVAVVHD